MINYLILILITFIPTLELRASIPYGILLMNLPWWQVFIVSVTANILLGILLYLVLEKIISLFCKIKWIDNIYQKKIIKTQKKIEPYIEKYGELGIALFIAIPLPGSGSYTGALAAYLIGLDRKKFFIANLIGVVIAGIIVTIVVVSGNVLASFITKSL